MADPQTDLGTAMALSPYDVARDRALVLSWANAPETVFWLTGQDAPITGDDLDAWHRAGTVMAWMMLRQGHPVGYGELHLHGDQRYLQLVRLLVEPAHRQQGVGRSLVRALVAQARALQPDWRIYARIAPGNRPALLMYPFAGLVPLEPLPPGFDPTAIWLTARDEEPAILGGRIDDE